MTIPQPATPAPSGIAVTTSITAGANDCTSGNCSDPTNHAEGLARQRGHRE